jgi:hypothetical protein
VAEAVPLQLLDDELDAGEPGWAVVDAAEPGWAVADDAVPGIMLESFFPSSSP